jgi:hypothetical protein
LDAGQSFPKNLEASCKQLTACVESVGFHSFDSTHSPLLSSLDEIRQTLDSFRSQYLVNKLLNHEDIAKTLADTSTDIGIALLKFNVCELHMP